MAGLAVCKVSNSSACHVYTTYLLYLGMLLLCGACCSLSVDPLTNSSYVARCGTGLYLPGIPLVARSTGLLQCAGLCDLHPYCTAFNYIPTVVHSSCQLLNYSTSPICWKTKKLAKAKYMEQVHRHSLQRT